jgi:hypothetical protein
MMACKQEVKVQTILEFRGSHGTENVSVIVVVVGSNAMLPPPSGLSSA